MQEIKNIIFVLELIGTVAFASSGAILAIKKNMDLFGVNVMALITAVGGGIIRDVLIGRFPPTIFSNSIYVILALAIANVIFLVLYLWQNKDTMKKFAIFYDDVLLWSDAAGLAVFTITGVNTGIQEGFQDNTLLLVVIGVITGVGGGIMRDIMANEKPYVLVKHFYACASVCGAITIVFLYGKMKFSVVALLSFSVTMLLRIFAIKFRWNLPKIENKENEKE